ncbi:hypothetical protein JW935_15120 [candidate division KSB1 bacterium]|nr:hypothetical protein [candidate division KSB1 bacterium]
MLNIWSVVFITGIALGQTTKPVPNLDIFKTNIEKILGETFSSIKIDHPVILKNTEFHADDWFIESQITTWLKKNGNTDVFSWNTTASIIEKNGAVIKQAGSTSDTLRLDCPFILEYRPIQLETVYKRKKTESDSLSRSITVVLYLKTIQSSRIYFADTFRQQSVDVIASRDMEKVENAELKFTIGEKPISLIKRLYEPALVSVFTGSVIYFFYSFRSK